MKVSPGQARAGTALLPAGNVGTYRFKKADPSDDGGKVEGAKQVHGATTTAVSKGLPPWRAGSVAALLLRGGVIAYPTEGVWGLGCNPADEEAVTRILTLKRRAVSKGLILVAGDMDAFAPLLDGLTAEELARLDAAWPGPHTFLVPHRRRVPPWIHGASDKVALRVSAHPLVAALAADAGTPLVSTSANPAGRKPALTALRVRQYFRRGIDLVVPGELGGATGPSSITDLKAMTLVRPAP